MICLTWVAIEVRLSLTRRDDSAVSTQRDRGSLLELWIVACAATGIALALRPTVGSFRIPPETRLPVASLIVLAGLAVRLAAIRTLGRQFTVNVVIRDGHELIDRGIYSVLRHPSYTGLLIGFVGAAFSLGSWIRAAVVLIPVVLVLLRRIGLEERVLRSRFGQDYDQYCNRTRRLIPGLF